MASKRIAIFLLLFGLASTGYGQSLLKNPAYLASLKAQAAGGEAECNVESESLLNVEGVLSTGDKYFATAVTNLPGDICAIEILMSRNASETNTFHIDWCISNATNRPGTVIATSETVPAASIGTTTNWVRFNFTTPFTPTSGSTTTNWIRRAKTVDPVSGLAAEWARANGNVEIVVRSQNGDDWTLVDGSRQGNYKIIRE